MAEQDQLWDFEQAAHYLHCSPGTIRVWTSQRKLPFVRVGSRLVRYRKRDLDQWVEAHGPLEE